MTTLKYGILNKHQPKQKAISGIKKYNLKILEPYLYLLPSLLVFAFFVFYPFIKTLYLSLNSTDAQGRIIYFVGFQNYMELFLSHSFQNSIIVSFKFAFMVVIPSVLIGFILAVLGNVRIKGISLFRTIYALPMAISSACAAIIWLILFHPSIGIINYILNSSIGYLTDSKWALPAISIVTVWMNIGINYIFMIAGLQNIPRELYESASIDGAGIFRKHLSVTIPSLSPVLFFIITIDIINSFQAFGQVNLMTSGGPGEATNVLEYLIYRDAFFNNRFGMASAESIILFILLLILTLLQFQFGEKRVNY
ncbi:MAG TPA: glycerol-3-phosphate ABC transporter permease [Clostridiaceae bacterium]|nr:glycerol-3-phosphate ABC transporter permease [Clostridiaceae bacterium]